MASEQHSDLCSRAKRWLRNSFGCQVAFEELETSAGEQPDAFGLRHGLTVLIEVKVSRSDFMADKKKPWREKNQGMGAIRYFLAPKGLLSPDEMPKGWGLLEATAKQIRVKKGIDPRVDGLYYYDLEGSEFFFNERDVFSETYLIASVLRRVELRVGDLQEFTKGMPEQAA